MYLKTPHRQFLPILSSILFLLEIEALLASRLMTTSMYALPIYDSIICFGDSLTQRASQVGGFVASLQHEYQRKLEVVSRGFGGYTSRQAIALCPTLFSGESSEQGSSAKLGIIWFGTNDSIAEGFGQHVPIEEYEANMTSVINTFAATDVLLITPGTVVPGRFNGHLDDKSMIEYGQALYKVAKNVSSQRRERGEVGKITILDMNATFKSAATKIEGGLSSLFIQDGLHISQAGYQVVFEAVLQAIFTEFPHLHPDKLPFVLPHWSSLNLAADQQGQSEQLQIQQR